MCQLDILDSLFDRLHYLSGCLKLYLAVLACRQLISLAGKHCKASVFNNILRKLSGCFYNRFLNVVIFAEGKLKFTDIASVVFH